MPAGASQTKANSPADALSLVFQPIAPITVTASSIELHDAYRFRINLDRHLRLRPADARPVLLALEEFLASTRSFQTTLRPVSTGAENPHASLAHRNHDTFIHLLLGVQKLQSGVVELLLTRLLELDMEREKAHISTTLVLSQLRHLDTIYNPSELQESLFELIDEVSPSLRRDIVCQIPSILPDCDEEVARKLFELMHEDLDSVSTYLDALSNLRISDKLSYDISDRVLELSLQTRVEHLPSILIFLVQAAGSSDTIQRASIIGRMRAGVFKYLRTSAGDNRPDHVVLLVEALRRSLASNRNVAVTLLKDIADSGSHSVVDIWICIICLSFNKLSSRSSGIFRSHLSSKHFSQSLLQSALPTAYQHAFQSDFDALCSSACTLLSFKSPSECRAGQTLYTRMFECFSEISTQQRLLERLLFHVDSVRSLEVSCALSVLTQVVYSSELEQTLIRNSAFFTPLLDTLYELSLEHARSVYAVLVRLAVLNQDFSPLEILLHKQLRNSDIVYTRLGVLGSFVFAAALDDPDRVSEVLGKIYALFQDKGDFLGMFYFFQEVLHATTESSVNPGILMSCFRMLDEELFELFFVSLDDQMLGNLRFGLSEKSNFALNLSAKVFSGPTSCDLALLPSMFAAHSATMRLHDFDHYSEFLEVFLGCPIVFPEDSTVKALAINWFRVLLNSYTPSVISSRSPPLCAMILNRISHLKDLELSLELGSDSPIHDWFSRLSISSWKHDFTLEFFSILVLPLNLTGDSSIEIPIDSYVYLITHFSRILISTLSSCDAFPTETHLVSTITSLGTSIDDILALPQNAELLVRSSNPVKVTDLAQEYIDVCREYLVIIETLLDQGTLLPLTILPSLPILFTRVQSIIALFSSVPAFIQLGSSVLLALAKLDNSQNLSEDLSRFAKLLLTSNWGASPKPKTVQALVHTFISQSSDPMNTISSFTVEANILALPVSELLSAYSPTLSVTTCASYYKAICSSFISCFGKITCFSSYLPQLSQSAVIFEHLVSIARQVDSEAIHVITLRSARQYLELVLKRIRSLSTELAERPEGVAEILQRICYGSRNVHGRAAATVQKLVPKTKQVLEAFAFAVKSLFVEQDAAQAFKFNFMKHRA